MHVKMFLLIARKVQIDKNVPGVHTKDEEMLLCWPASVDASEEWDVNVVLDNVKECMVG